MKIHKLFLGIFVGIALTSGCGRNKTSEPVYEKVNVFDNVSVEISGIAPYARAEIKVSEDAAWYDLEDFSLSKSEEIRNGDIITVSCNVPIEEARAAGYELILENKTYIVPPIDMYINDLNQLCGDILTEIVEEEMQAIHEDTENLEERMLYRLTGNSNYLFQYNKEWIESAEVYKVILCTPMDYQNAECEKNIIYVVLKAVAANSDYKEEGYFVFEYKNAIITGDGMMYVNHENARETYYASSEYEELYQLLVESKAGQYYVGMMDGEEISTAKN